MEAPQAVVIRVIKIFTTVGSNAGLTKLATILAERVALHMLHVINACP